MLDKKFDLIFVDGEHGFKAVKIDTRNVFALRKDANSNIVWHDYGYDTEDVRFEVLAAILSGIPKKEHSKLYHVSNTMCAVYLENYIGNGMLHRKSKIVTGRLLKLPRFFITFLKHFQSS